MASRYAFSHSGQGGVSCGACKVLRLSTLPLSVIVASKMNGTTSDCAFLLHCSGNAAARRLIRRGAVTSPPTSYTTGVGLDAWLAVALVGVSELSRGTASLGGSAGRR